MGFIGALTLLLVAAKLFGFAHYSWLIAFSPLLAGIVVAAVIVVVVGAAKAFL